ncbi:unnamed protein product [Knipowitschia caucasica]
MRFLLLRCAQAGPERRRPGAWRGGGPGPGEEEAPRPGEEEARGVEKRPEEEARGLERRRPAVMDSTERTLDQKLE